MDFSHPTTISIFGEPGSGKSSAIKYYALQLASQKKIDYIFVFTNQSTKNDGDYDWVKPDKFVVTKNHSIAIDKVVNCVANTKLRGLIIFDDITGTVEFKGRIYDKLFTEYRHIGSLNKQGGGVTVIASIHYVKKLPPIMRDCAKNVWIFNQGSKNSMLALYEAFGITSFNTSQEFFTYLNANTDFAKHIFLCYQKNNARGDRFKPVVLPWPINQATIDVGKTQSIQRIAPARNRMNSNIQPMDLTAPNSLQSMEDDFRAAVKRQEDLMLGRTKQTGPPIELALRSRRNVEDFLSEADKRKLGKKQQ